MKNNILVKYCFKLVIISILILTSLNASNEVPTKEEVSKLYVATFNRAADSAGLDYWVNNSHLSLSKIAKSFFDQSETQALYPSSILNEEFINSVYQNLFNREADSDGLNYWQNELDSGSIEKSVFILAVINGALDTDESQDATILNNKNEVGLFFADAGLNDGDDAKIVLEQITDDYSTVAYIKTKISTNTLSADVWQDISETSDTNITSTTQIYKPSLSTSWQWQLQGDVNTSYDVDMYDIDLFDSSVELIQTLKDSGKKVICYFSAGSYEDWRSDAESFSSSILGNDLDGWAGERWLDIGNIELLSPIMKARLDLAKAKGCDGVEPDNVDGYTNNSGFDLSADDQLVYNKFLANEAHVRGLSVGLKNDLNQVVELEPFFDFTVNEQCHFYDECSMTQAFINASKPVFNVEYADKYLEDDAMTKLCNSANSSDITTLIMPLNLDDSFRYDCRDFIYNKFKVGYGGASSFKFHNNVWLNSTDLMFGNFADVKNAITDFNEDIFNELSTYLQKSRYVVFWVTKNWEESWFDMPKIQELIDNGKVPVFIYWYFGDDLLNGFSDEKISAYFSDVERLNNLLSSLNGEQLLILEPEFNKDIILLNEDNTLKFISTMKSAISVFKQKARKISLCMMDTGSRDINSINECGYDNCSLGDKSEWARVDTIYSALKDDLDFISFEQMIGQFSRDDSDPGTWESPNPKAYTDDEVGIDNLAIRIDNMASYLKQKYNKAIFLPYITIATATWEDYNNDGVISSDELDADGWSQKASNVYENLNSTSLFGYATMELFDNPTHDDGGYQYFIDNEYHLGIVTSDIVDSQLSGNINFKSNIIQNIFK